MAGTAAHGTVPGPGVNVGAPGDPFYAGPARPSAAADSAPSFRVAGRGTADLAALEAPWLPVEWNSEVNAWGVHWNGGFKTAPFCMTRALSPRPPGGATVS